MGITGEKARHEGGDREMAGAATDRWWGVVSGRAVRSVVAGGSRGWSLMINYRPLISYPTAGKSNDQR